MYLNANEEVKYIKMERQNGELLYLDPRLHTRHIVDRFIENALTVPLNVNTEGTEKNIPKAGPLVVGLMPYTDWLAPFVVNRYLTYARDRSAVWMTNKETENKISGFLLGNRKFFFVDRQSPSRAEYKTAFDILWTGGVLASAFEGTRYGNSDDPDDNLTLGEFKSGLMRG